MSQRTEAVNPLALDATRVTAVPVGMLMPDPQQPRTDFDEAAIKALATNIATYGIESPLIVRGDYVIKHGERRWRAAKLAGLTHVPCLLAGDADPEHPGREWLLDQYAHNALQRSHTAIETAATLKRLVEQHGFKVGELPKLLAARGIDISRPQASNLMRLLDLPDWAQTHINTGRLSPAHGRALLTAKSPKVIEKLREVIEEWDDDNDPLTADAIEDAVVDSYRDLHINLSRSWGEQAPKFNVETCKGCAERHEVGNQFFCLDEACFGEKQAKAAAAGEGKDHAHSSDKSSAPTKVNPNKHGVIKTAGMPFGTFHDLSAADFDTAGCEGCEYRAPASRDGKPAAAAATCFHIPCWDDKTAAHRKQLSGADRLAATCLDDWVRDRLREKLADDAVLRFQLLVWMASGMQSQDSFGNGTVSAVYGLRPFQSLLTVAAAEEAGTLDVMPILDAGLHHLLAARAEAYAYARHVGVTLTAQNWRVDARYFDLKTKPELLKMLTQASESVPIVEYTALKSLKRDALIERFTPEVIQALGVPADVADLFATLEPDSGPGDEDDDDEPDHGDDAGQDLDAAGIEPGDFDPRQDLEKAGA